MNSADDRAKELEGQRWNDLAAGRREDEEELVALYVGELDALSLEEWYLAALLILWERVLDSNLGQEHLLRRVVGGVLDHF